MRDETQKIQIIEKIYRVGGGIRGSDLGISKYGSRPAAGTVEISTKQSVQWDQHAQIVLNIDIQPELLSSLGGAYFNPCFMIADSLLAERQICTRIDWRMA